MAVEQPYRVRFKALYTSLQNDLGMSPDRALRAARQQLGPDPDQPDLDSALRSAAASQATRLGWRFLVLPRVAQYLGLIAGIGWGSTVVLRALGAPEASDWIASLLGNLGIAPPAVHLLGAAAGATAATVVAGKVGKVVS
jgi:hypothetical protein